MAEPEEELLSLRASDPENPFTLLPDSASSPEMRFAAAAPAVTLPMSELQPVSGAPPPPPPPVPRRELREPGTEAPSPGYVRAAPRSLKPPRQRPAKMQREAGLRVLAPMAPSQSLNSSPAPSPMPVLGAETAAVSSVVAAAPSAPLSKPVVGVEGGGLSGEAAGGGTRCGAFEVSGRQGEGGVVSKESAALDAAVGHGEEGMVQPDAQVTCLTLPICGRWIA